MSLRRPAAHLRRAPGWRRSGDESCWESLIAEGEFLPRASRPPSSRRPQSAIEGRQLDGWLEHLQLMQSDPRREPVRDHVPVFNARTTSSATLDQTGRTWGRQGTPSYSRSSSSCGSPSLCESSLGSQESLRTGVFFPSERRGSSERAHITQAPRKQQTQLSHLAPVRIGWLPIQRRVMVVADGGQNPSQILDQSAGQVKLKQPITPTFWKNRATPRPQDGEVGGTHTSPKALGVEASQTADRGSPAIKQVTEKRSSPDNEGTRLVGWQALRRGWNSVRASAFPGCSRSIERNSDPNGKSPPMSAAGVEALEHARLHGATSAEPCGPQTLPQGTNRSAEARSPRAPLHRANSVQPVRATAPLLAANSGPQPSRIQTSSAVTTLIPQNKAGFSSITISSRKVSRSSSLPDPDTRDHSSRSPPPSHRPVDPNYRHVTVQRKATIVKVTEQRVTSGPVPGAKSVGAPPASQGLDTVVHRRRATIIKVTEHRESYSPAKVGPGTRPPEYRHSYIEGVYEGNDTCSRGNQSQHTARPSCQLLDSTKTPGPSVARYPATPDPEESGGALHRSTASLFMSNPPAVAATAPPAVSPRAAGQRWDGPPRRPRSCYGDAFGHTEPSGASATRPAARKWSFGLPPETATDPVNLDRGPVGPGAAVEDGGQPVARGRGPSRGEEERAPAPGAAVRRASSCLTLIPAPDPHSHQSPEEVLALNAAAVIANIKLQRQLSKKKTPHGNSAKDSAASLQGNTVTDMCVKQHPDRSPARRHKTPHAAFVPLSLDPETSPGSVSLQESLRRARPDLIRRSQGRVQELERRARARRGKKTGPTGPRSGAAPRQRRAHRVRSTSLNDNLVRPSDRVITGKEMHLGSKGPADVKRKKDEEKNREVCLTNRQRVELFKKRLLDQILQRGNN